MAPARKTGKKGPAPDATAAPATIPKAKNATSSQTKQKRTAGGALISGSLLLASICVCIVAVMTGQMVFEKRCPGPIRISALECFKKVMYGPASAAVVSVSASVSISGDPDPSVPASVVVAEDKNEIASEAVEQEPIIVADPEPVVSRLTAEIEAEIEAEKTETETETKVCLCLCLFHVYV